jgi:AcrR family transcriptional regulator
LPRHPDPELEQRILNAACKLWARGGAKALTMRAVAKTAGTTTPTVYERYHDRADILRALRRQTRHELFSELGRTRTLAQATERYLAFALRNPHAYEVLFDSVAQPPSLHEPWPSFNFLRHRLAQRLGGDPRDHTRLMLALWSLMHGTAMLIIRGRFAGVLRTQTIRASIEALEAVVREAERTKGKARPKWPRNLILGEGPQSRVSQAAAEHPQKPKPEQLAKRRRRH